MNSRPQYEHVDGIVVKSLSKIQSYSFTRAGTGEVLPQIVSNYMHGPKASLEFKGFGICFSDRKCVCFSDRKCVTSLDKGEV
jgi:hypothetical protein